MPLSVGKVLQVDYRDCGAGMRMPDRPDAPSADDSRRSGLKLLRSELGTAVQRRSASDSGMRRSGNRLIHRTGRGCLELWWWIGLAGHPEDLGDGAGQWRRGPQ